MVSDVNLQPYTKVELDEFGLPIGLAARPNSFIAKVYNAVQARPRGLKAPPVSNVQPNEDTTCFQLEPCFAFNSNLVSI